METELQSCQEQSPHNVAKQAVKEEDIHCPICFLPAGRRIRGKVYCGNCGSIES